MLLQLPCNSRIVLHNHSLVSVYQCVVGIFPNKSVVLILLKTVSWLVFFFYYYYYYSAFVVELHKHRSWNIGLLNGAIFVNATPFIVTCRYPELFLICKTE